MSSEMIERVANAFLAAQWAHDPSQGNAFWQLDTLPEASRAYWLDLARAAIAAMREPTEAMKDKGENALVFGPTGNRLDESPSATWAVAWECWSWMIDEALR